MTGLRVSELARRSGVPATTLRFYEQQGLLPAGRTSGGYRDYDEAAVDRLAFIATTKRLGLTLPEIRGLLDPWQHGGCRDVQAELAPLLEARAAEVRDRVAELGAFARELDAAREHLAVIDRDGPCDRSCSFRSRAGRPVRDLPHPGRDGSVSGRDGDPPDGDGDPLGQDGDACSLGDARRAGRVERWRDALSGAAARRALPGGVRVELGPGVDVAEIARLAAAEADCCSFLELRLCFDPGPALEVRAPDRAADVLVELFGAASS